jgi:hypothetical protein
MILWVAGSAAVGIAAIVYAACKEPQPNATVRTPTAVYENCHVKEVFRGSVRLRTAEGNSVTIVGCAEIEWIDKEGGGA